MIHLFPCSFLSWSVSYFVYFCLFIFLTLSFFHNWFIRTLFFVILHTVKHVLVYVQGIFSTWFISFHRLISVIFKWFIDIRFLVIIPHDFHIIFMLFSFVFLCFFFLNIWLIYIHMIFSTTDLFAIIYTSIFCDLSHCLFRFAWFSHVICWFSQAYFCDF